MTFSIHANDVIRTDHTTASMKCYIPTVCFSLAKSTSTGTQTWS